MFAKYSGRYPTLLSSLVPLPNVVLCWSSKVALHHNLEMHRAGARNLVDVDLVSSNQLSLQTDGLRTGQSDLKLQRERPSL